jgi:TolA-binding protein
MRIKTVTTTVSLVLALALAGCLKTRAELRGDEGGGAEMQKQTQDQQRREKEITSRPAPPPAPKVDDYDEQLRQLNGRVDSTENRVSQLMAAQEAEKSGEGKERLAEKQLTEKRFLAYEEALTKLDGEVKALSEEVARLKAPPSARTTGKAPGKQNAFEEGEAQFAGKKWKDAIVLYQRYRDAYPKGKMFLEATYKIGVCFQELGMKDEARSFYEEVTAKAPKSKEARKASKRMKSLK